MPVHTDAAGEQAWNSAAISARPASVASRVWLWPRPAIVLGCAQRGLAEAVRDRVGSRIEVRVREAGGGAVLVGPWMIGVSLVLPASDPRAGRSPTDGYAWLSLRLVEALRSAGCNARAVPPAELRGSAPDGAPAAAPRADAWPSATPVTWACFGSLSPWEIVDARGRKLVGLAQRRTRDAVLLVAGVLATEPQWEILCSAMGYPGDAQRLRQLTAACLPTGAQATELSARIEAEIARY
ncbi:ligase [Burkholderiaceae bacterium FT117]|uniref:lipoyl protein ligase domain-containing protein n=1 Tax=Zeimonas sediminis TaxID=2944268 RepID=UPI002342EB90|nr:ligase [Zeimonas sediminis]MCM5569133.1 ligase [Zeimonas sediminis]